VEALLDEVKCNQKTFWGKGRNSNGTHDKGGLTVWGVAGLALNKWARRKLSHSKRAGGKNEYLGKKSPYVKGPNGKKLSPGESVGPEKKGGISKGFRR